jgi:hypothetical protein
VPMPLNLAIFGVNKASVVMDAFPYINCWIIGGHSLGGAMAARFIDKNRSALRGLVLWSSYPVKNNALSSASDLATVSIYETFDGRAITENIDIRRSLLPLHTRWVPIEGACHA